MESRLEIGKVQRDYRTGRGSYSADVVSYFSIKSLVLRSYVVTFLLCSCVLAFFDGDVLVTINNDALAD